MEKDYDFFSGPGFAERQKEIKEMEVNLNKTKNLFGDLPEFSGDEFKNDFEFKKPTIGKSQDYMNPLTAKSDEDVSKGINFMKLGAEGGNEATDSVSSGGSTGDVVGSTSNFATSIFKSASTTAKNEGESITSGLSMAASGATAGMAIAGPVGGIVGGAVGLAYGIYDGFADVSKREKEARKENAKNFEGEKALREQEQRMKDGKDSLERLTAVRKAQLGYMI